MHLLILLHAVCLEILQHRFSANHNYQIQLAIFQFINDPTTIYAMFDQWSRINRLSQELLLFLAFCVNLRRQ